MAVTHVTMENYTEEILHAEGPVLIDFFATWCNPCKMLAPEVEAFAAETDAVKVCKIDVDEASDIAMLYGIMSIPTLVLVKNGKEVARQTGGCEKDDIAAFCNANA